ncbi:MAG TPA: hypothetical protein VII24_10385 [Pseudolabrys sp.]
MNILARSGVIWWDGPNARTMRTWIRIIVIAAAGMAAAVPVRAEISADLAKNCRAMMAKAHPTQMYGASGTAALQRDYFRQCINRQGTAGHRFYHAR